MELRLQFFGGRGAGNNRKSAHDGDIKTKNELDVWAERDKPNQTESALHIINATKFMQDEYGVMENVNDVLVADMSQGSVLAFYDPANNEVVFNRAFMDADKIKASYDNCVASKFHPPLGGKDPIEAVTVHELGHALADRINEARRAGKYTNNDVNSEVVINAWRKLYPDKAHTYHELVDLPKSRKNISGYAMKNYHETVAEAVADVFCNGGRAKKFSKAIVEELKATAKKELKR